MPATRPAANSNIDAARIRRGVVLSDCARLRTALVVIDSDVRRECLHYPIVMPNIAFLECSRCHLHYDPATPQTVCTACSGTLYVHYDLSAVAGTAQRDAIGTDGQDKRWSGMWRYRLVLPGVEPVTLGEGWTPMLPSRRHANVRSEE